jgi:hypothetical protein
MRYCLASTETREIESQVFQQQPVASAASSRLEPWGMVHAYDREKRNIVCGADTLSLDVWEDKPWGGRSFLEECPVCADKLKEHATP